MIFQYKPSFRDTLNLWNPPYGAGFYGSPGLLCDPQEAKEELIASLHQKVLEQQDCGSEGLERQIKSKKKELQAKKEELLGLLMVLAQCIVNLLMSET